MKFKIFSLTFALAAMAALTGCGDDWQPGGGSQFAPGTGGVYSGTINVDVASEPTKAQGRAYDDTDRSSFIVTVTPKGSDNIASYDGETCRWTYSNMPEIITLPVGEYTVHIVSHEPEAVAWSTPYFEGQTDFTVVNNKVVNIGTVHCSFRSLKIGVNFDEDFLEMMDNEKSYVSITAGAAGTSSVWTPGESRFAYYYLTEDNPTVIAYFNGLIDGQTYTAGKTINTARIGDFYIFTFSLNRGNPEPPEEFGSTTIPSSGINIDVDMIREELENQLKPGEDFTVSDEKHPNAEEWPDPIDPGTDPENPDDPTPPGPSTDSGVTATVSAGMLLNGVNDVKEGQEYKITFATEAPITAMWVDIDSPEFLDDEMLESVGLVKRFNLADPETDDLKEGLDGLGLPTDDKVKGQKSVIFDLSGLVTLLDIDPESHKHKFIVTISTEGRPEYVQTFIFRNLK